MARVLVVDDSKSVRIAVAVALESAGYECVHAADGVEGCEIIFAGGIDCVVSDVVMPNKDGIELVHDVRSDPRFYTLPILMLTTEVSARRVAQARKAGSSGWMVKPVKRELLVASVRRLLELVGKPTPTTEDVFEVHGQIV